MSGKCENGQATAKTGWISTCFLFPDVFDVSVVVFDATWCG